MLPTIDQHFLGQLIQQINNANAKTINELKQFQTPRTIQLQGGDPSIVLFETNKGVYSSNDCDNINTQALNGTNLFHQILLHHNGEFSKEQILEGFFEVVEDDLFIPIAYRRGPKIDYFFVAKEVNALNQIFKKKLLLPMKGRSIQIVVKLGVAECKDNHRFYAKFGDVISMRMKMSTRLGGSQVLDLDKLHEHPELREMSFSLGNTSTLDLLLNHINSVTKLKKGSNYRIFKFANNGIKSLQAFSQLYNMDMETLDLSENKIKDYKELTHLKDLNVKEIYLKGNECAQNPENLEKIRDILSGLRKIDDISVSTMLTLYKTNIKGEPLDVGNNPIPPQDIQNGTMVNSKNRAQMLKNFFAVSNKEQWDKVVIQHDEKYKPEQLIAALANNVCYNAIFFPCFLRRFKQRDEFYLYKNAEAIKIIMQAGMVLQMTQNIKYSIVIYLNVADFKKEQVQWSENLKYVINFRTKYNKLNLNNFIEQEELLQHMFIRLTNNNFGFILDQARINNNQITEMHFENCNLTRCEAFSILPAFQKLKVLNLRNNNIECLDGIKSVSSIVEVFLDGNPLCNRPPRAYIDYVQNFFTRMEYLDGQRVHQDSDQGLVTFQNYLKTIDVYTVVDEFLKQFFTLWDSFERGSLKQMYRNNSMMSLCINYEYIKGKENLPFSEIFPRVQKFVKFDRNLKKLSDTSKAYAKVYVGPERIEQIINDLPLMKHDLSNCNIDVPYFDPQKSQLIIIVSGYVKVEESPNEEFPFLVGFTRTFVIASENCEFFISNDQILLRNPTDAQREAASVTVRPTRYEDLVENCRDLLPNENDEKTLKLVMLMELTSCKKEFCVKLLEDKFWDFKVALACFNIDLNENKVPDDAFNFK